MSAKPKINDQYWFDYSEKLVSNSIDRLDKSIEKVQKFTTALLATYTASAIFTIEYKDVDELWLIILFSLPYVVVLFGRWHATSSTIPKTIEFDPRIPDEIRESHLEIHEFKERRLKQSIYISLTATILVAITLMLGFYKGNKNNQEKEQYVNLVVNKNDSTLFINGNLPPKALINFRIDQKNTNQKRLSIPINSIINSNEGYFFASAKLADLSGEIKAYIEWSNNNEGRAFIKTLSLTK